MEEGGERIHTLFFFRSRLASLGVYYHLSNSIVLYLHRPGWELIAPEPTGEEESNCFYLLPDCILLVVGFCTEKRKMICFTYAMQAWSMAEREKYSPLLKISYLANICWGTACRAKKNLCIHKNIHTYIKKN